MVNNRKGNVVMNKIKKAQLSGTVGTIANVVAAIAIVLLFACSAFAIYSAAKPSQTVSTVRMSGVVENALGQTLDVVDDSVNGVWV